MEIPSPTKTTISGDLPIRSAKPLRQEDLPEKANTTEGPASQKVINPVPQQVTEADKKVMIDSQVQDLETEVATAVGTNVGRKKPKHRRPKSKRGQGKPTGFEEYYAEGPITPKEYEEMRKLYDP